MQALKLTIRPETAFGTPLVGDTFFGHLCWGIVEQYGEAFLDNCLQGYTAGKPFAIVSDAFPEGYLPLPTLPSLYWTQGEETDRKKLKKKQWLQPQALTIPSTDWQQHAQSNNDIQEQLCTHHMQAHNSLNRQTHTTGSKDQFAPYESEQIWYAPHSHWQIYLLIDETRLSRDQLRRVLENIGLSGYGRDAAAGLGKYSVLALDESGLFHHHQHGNAVFTLAASCPQQCGFDRQHSYYQPITRFGRHGNLCATGGQPFKKPILMAQTGAVFSGHTATESFIGNGIGGVSAAQSQAVHQGYAPVLAFDLDTAKLTSLSRPHPVDAA